MTSGLRLKATGVVAVPVRWGGPECRSGTRRCSRRSRRTGRRPPDPSNPTGIVANLNGTAGTLVATNINTSLVRCQAFRPKGVVMPIWHIHREIGIGNDRVVEVRAS